VDSADNWLGRIRRRESRVRLASSFLTTFLVFFVAGLAGIGYLILRNGWLYFMTLFQQRSTVFYAVLEIAGLAALIAGFGTYFLLRRKHNARLRELTTLTKDMKEKLATQGTKPSNGVNEEREGITADALSAAEKIVTLLPELVRKRDQDSLLFGAVGFLLALLFGGNFAVAVLVGVIVWLYFRYETRKTYDEEISKLEKQKEIFEQRKKDFLETL
jgi:hypothetical protein